MQERIVIENEAKELDLRQIAFVTYIFIDDSQAFDFNSNTVQSELSKKRNKEYRKDPSKLFLANDGETLSVPAPIETAYRIANGELEFNKNSGNFSFILKECSTVDSSKLTLLINSIFMLLLK